MLAAKQNTNQKIVAGNKSSQNKVRLLLNGAMLRLIESEGEDVDAAKTLIDHVEEFPEESSFAFHYHSRKEGGGSVTGYTKEHGNVTINDDTPVEKNFEVGFKKARIGQFKMFRRGEEIVFHDFWASDPETSSDESDMPAVYHLNFEGGVYRWFGIEVHDEGDDDDEADEGGEEESEDEEKGQRRGHTIKIPFLPVEINLDVKVQIGDDEIEILYEHEASDA